MASIRADRLVGAAALLSAVTLLAGCGGSAGSGAAAPSQPTTEVKIALSDAGCEPTPATVPITAGSTQDVAGGAASLSAGTGQLTGAEIAKALLPAFSDPDQQQAILNSFGNDLGPALQQASGVQAAKAAPFIVVFVLNPVSGEPGGWL